MNPRNIIVLVIIAIILVAIPVTLKLSQQQQQLKSKAAQPDYGTISVSKTSINKVSGNWEPIPVTGTIAVPGANDSKTVAGIYIRNTNSPAGEGWISTGQFFGSNGPVSFSYSPPGTFSAGSYEFGLFLMDGSNVVDVINTSQAVQFNEPVGTSPPVGTGANDVAECDYVAVRDSDGKLIYKTGSPPVSVVKVNQIYNVDIKMDNRDANHPNLVGNPWIKGDLGDLNTTRGKYYLGFPTAGDHGAGNFQINTDTVGTSHIISDIWGVNWPNVAYLRLPLNSDAAPAGFNIFRFSITPKEAGSHTFYWGMVQEGVGWFGGQCSSKIQVDPQGGPGPTASVGPTVAPTASAAPATVMFRIADGNTQVEALEKIASATYQNYLALTASKSMFLNYPLTDPHQGQFKYIAVQFKKGDIEKEATVKAIKFIGAKPTISSVLCEFSSGGDATKVTINGDNFGPQGKGIVKSGSKASEELSWEVKKVVVKFAEKLTTKFKVKLTTGDGQETEEKECGVNQSLIDFSVATQCSNGSTTGFTTDNVEVKIFENSLASDPQRPFHQQKIRLANGKPQSLGANLESGKYYSLLIKAPRTLARRVDFQAQQGTTVLNNTVLLPVGDIFPINAPDGVINQNDMSLLKSQWSLVRDVSRTGDLNGDSRVNSLDYSCMKNDSDAHKGDDVFTPPTVAPSSSPLPSGAAGTRSLKLSGKVFFDTNSDTAFNTDEQVIGGVNVKLLQVPDSHVVGVLLTAQELSSSTLLGQVSSGTDGVYTLNVTIPASILRMSFVIDPGATAGSGGQKDMGVLPATSNEFSIDIPVKP